MAIQRMSDQHKIQFLNEEKIEGISKQSSELPAKTLNQIAEEQKSKKLNNKDNGLMTVHNIFSARTGKIKDEGGPSKFVKSESSNTIWDNNKTAKISIDNKEKTLQEKEQILTNKRDAEKQHMDDMAEAISKTEQRKASSVSSLNSFEGSNYKALSNTISIFDTADFERLQEKTAGEQVSEDVSTRASQQDISWRDNNKGSSSKKIIRKLFDNLFK